MRWRHLDRIIAVEAWSVISGHKQISLELGAMDACRGIVDRLPAALLLATHAELACWLAVISSDYTQAAEPVAIEDWRAEESIATGDHLVVEARLQTRTASGFTVTLTTRRDDRVIASGACTCDLRPADDLMATAEWHRRWREMLVPEMG